jgi:hypothetical protein
MSYSYLKNVFPDFSESKSYNEPIYGFIKKPEKAAPSPIEDNEMAKYAKTIISENKDVLEGFTNNARTEVSCDNYMKHVLECEKCKETLSKHLKIDSNRIQNEEIMEIVSYITFGIFVLLVMENLRNG